VDWRNRAPIFFFAIAEKAPMDIGIYDVIPSCVLQPTISLKMADAKLMTLDISSDLPSDTAFPFDHKDRAPDYSNLDEVISKTDSEAVKAVCTLFRNYGSGEYIGEQITQWEHALQAAYMAKRAGAEEEVIIAALLHDIGHIYALAVHSKDYMGDYGASRHEHVGAEFLLSLGFTPLVASLVR